MFRLARTRPGRWYSHAFYSTIGPRLDALSYRLTRGRLMSGAGLVPMLLITTTGRRSGRPRTTPVAYLPDDGCVVLVASNVGSAGHPQWYLNLLARPAAVLSIGGVDGTYAARVASEGERRALWERLRRHAPTYEIYRERRGGELPVVVLCPASAYGRPAASSRR